MAAVSFSPVDRAQVAVATQMLAKAESTDADEEAFALVLRTYRLLAKVITEHDLARGHTTFGPLRRERRLLRDRRANNAQPDPSPEHAEAGTQTGQGGAASGEERPPTTPPRLDPAAQYRQQDGPGGRPSSLDLDL